MTLLLRNLNPATINVLNIFFGYLKYSSVTSMLFELGLPSFHTLLHNYEVSFYMSQDTCDNMLVRCLRKC